MERKETLDYSIDINNLKTIPFDKYEKRFTFIKNGKRYETSRIVADILSPIIRRMHFIDESLHEFSFTIKETKSEEDYFLSFLKLASFNNIKIDYEQQKHFMEYFYALGNIDEYIHILSKYSSNFTIENSINSLMHIIEVSEKHKEIEIQEKDIKELIDFIAKNFEEYDKNNLRKIKIEFLELIIHNENLKLEDEDSLLYFLLKLYENDHSCSSLFEYVSFSNVSKKLLQDFIDQFELDDLNVKVWKSICTRLMNSKPEIEKRPGRYIKPNYIEMKHQEGKEFQGIMKYLTKETQGNIHDNETITITSNSISSNNQMFHPKNVVDYDSETYYCKENRNENANIVFDFKDKQVELESYSIKTYRNPQGYEHLKSWVIEVSNDNYKWTAIDYHNDDGTLNGPGIIGTFVVKKQEYGFYRYIRLKQTGRSWCNYGNVFAIVALDFYGKITLPNDKE